MKCRLADVEPKDSKTWSESVRLLHFIVVSIYCMVDISEIFYTLNTYKKILFKFMVPIIVDCQFFVRFNFCGFTSARFIYDQEIIITCIKIQFVSDQKNLFWY